MKYEDSEITPDTAEGYVNMGLALDSGEENLWLAQVIERMKDNEGNAIGMSKK